MNQAADAPSELNIRLSEMLGSDRVSANLSLREHHGRGEGLRLLGLPDLVVYPESTEEVAQTVGLCAAMGAPVVPFGAGTSLEGHVAATKGGVSLDMTRMNRVLQVSAEDLDCRIEAGVTRTQLNAEIRDLGLFFPLDPGADATLGGMASTRASGTNAIRYGTMREVTLGLTVVTPQGQVIRTGGRPRKSSAGYDLTRLYVGAEGTLGVITELRLRLFGIPEVIMSASCQFADLESAVATVVEALQIGVPMARIELMDALQTRAVIAYSGLSDLEPLPTLLLEFHGGPAAVAEQVDQLQAIADAHGGSRFRRAATTEERSRMWKARHDAYYAALALKPGWEGLATDICVPISALAPVMMEARALVEAAGLLGPIVGHVGDGNFHLILLHDPSDPVGRETAERLASELARLSVRNGGTTSGEHGVGLHKLDLIEAEHGPAIDIMGAIKQALDPLGIMNPGKTVPPHRVRPIDLGNR